MRILSFLLATAGLLFAVPASAEWYRARTPHFVLTIDDTAENTRDFALRLEQFDMALRRIYDVPDDPDQHSRPVQIYVVKPGFFFEVCGPCTGALGYYRPLARSSAIISAHMPSNDRSAKVGAWSSQTVLLHEYAHHFTYNNFPMAFPLWFSEGFAEYNANATFEPDGSVIIGYPANYRARSLTRSDRISMRQLLDPVEYGYGGDIDQFYGRGWLLTHYLSLHQQRKGQLAKYLSLLNSGVASVDAAERSFGDLGQLKTELNRYAKGRLAPPLRVTLPAVTNVTVRPLTAGEVEMLPVEAALRSGPRKSAIKGLARRAAKVVERYPTDVSLHALRAEAEFAAKDYAQAEQAADMALRLKPDSVEALIVKGMVAAKRLKDSKSSDPAAWAAARSWFVKANKAQPNAVLPLYLYYSSFVDSKEKVPAGAVKGLMRAHVLAPESMMVRAALARQNLADGNVKAARALLEPLAFGAHSSDDNPARKIIALIDAGKIAEAKAEIEPDEDEKE